MSSLPISKLTTQSGDLIVPRLCDFRTLPLGRGWGMRGLGKPPGEKQEALGCLLHLQCQVQPLPVSVSSTIECSLLKGLPYKVLVKMKWFAMCYVSRRKSYYKRGDWKNYWITIRTQEVLCRPLTMHLLGGIMNRHTSESFIAIRSTQNMFYSVVY